MTTIETPTPEWPKTHEVLARLHAWSKPLREQPDFRAFNRRKISAAIDLDGRDPEPAAGNFDIPSEIAAEYDAVMKFYYLHAACDRLQSLHLYFRRYPFRPGEMRKVEHLQNMFDLFSSAFYVVLQRVETYLNALEPLAGMDLQIGWWVKRYRKDFANELGPRNQTTHHRPYDDIVYDRLWVSEVMGLKDGDGGASWQREHQAIYRRETRR
ncbi:MAG: hypothetical protein AB1942_00065 [Pseudomonadota bacterium]